MFENTAPESYDQDIMIVRTKDTSISSTCRPIPSTTIADKWVYASLYIECRPAYCWFNAGQSYASLAQHWNRIGWLSRVFSDCYTGDSLYPERPLPGYHDTLAKLWLQRWANIIPTKTLLALNHEYNREYLFLRLLKHESTQPRDLKRYIGQVHIYKDWCTEMSTVSQTPRNHVECGNCMKCYESLWIVWWTTHWERVRLQAVIPANTRRWPMLF